MPGRPTGIFQQAIDALLDKDMPRFIALFAPDAVMEFPFAPPGQPRRIAGLSALHDYLIGYPDLLDVREISDVTIHETADPEIIVVEFTSTGAAVATGQPFELRYIAVLTVRDGELVHYRDYWNPMDAQELLGGGLVRS